MKKISLIFCMIACMAFVFAAPAFGDNSRTGTMESNYNTRSMGNTVPDTGIRSGIERGIDNTTRALDADRTTNMTANNYRATATDDRAFNWSWLGLLGLLGLIGLRSRDRERT
ncbi:WGxxGxxG family protein [Paenibacillus paridis]|uniref:WGxxGxxG family protein n=1 Tax=Paenibacillus paridis TaxID=2583376 RepID=UPI00111EC137|nr:WGxxGxxG family protein [Paenibacillus paridis]